MKKLIIVGLGLATLLSLQPLMAQQSKPKEKMLLAHGAHREGKRTDAVMEKWRGYGLGQFIHWGLYAIPGGEWNGKQYNGAAEWIRSWNGIPNSTYDSLIYKFNPTAFDATAWAKSAKQISQ